MRIVRVIDAKGAEVYAAQREEGRLLRLSKCIFGETPAVTDEVVSAKRRLCPVEPRAIFCIGANYRRHAEESGIAIPKWPVVFMKNISAAAGHEQAIQLPKVCEDEVDYEGELAVVIGQVCKDVSCEKALEYVWGYMAANDISARVWQKDKGGGQWVRGKSFDGFAPMGPALTTAEEIADPNALRIRTELNGQTMQDSNTRDMIFDVRTLISFLSQDTTLLPGTVILTGTPEGVGWSRKPKQLLHAGDRVSVEIEKIGKLVNTIV